MRLMLDCWIAAKLPTIMVASAQAHTMGSQRLGDGSEGGHKDAQQNRERRGFGADRKESGDRRGAPW